MAWKFSMSFIIDAGSVLIRYAASYNSTSM